MNRPQRKQKPGPPARPPSAAPALSSGAAELRALLRRVPDGLKATVASLGARPAEAREPLMAELTRTLGKEALPLLRAAALGPSDELALSALRVLPLLGTRAAADILAEAYRARPDGETARVAWQGAQALRARGVRVNIDAPQAPPAEEKYQLRDAYFISPSSRAMRSVCYRAQDRHGVWHTILFSWTEPDALRGCIVRAISRSDWAERMEANDTARIWLECPGDFVRWLADDARARLPADSKIPEAESPDVWFRLVGTASEGYTPPDPLADLERLPKEEADRLLVESGELFQEDPALIWACPPSISQAAGTELLRLSPGNWASQEPVEGRDEIISRAADAGWTEEAQPGLQRKLIDTARCHALRGRLRESRTLAAVSRALASGTSPAEIPLLWHSTRDAVYYTAFVLERESGPYRGLK